MHLYDHGTTLLSLYVVNFSGRTDTETVRGCFQLLPVFSTQDLARYANYTCDWVSGHCPGTGPFLLCSCLRVGDAHWCSLPFEIILVHNFLFLVKGNKAFNILMGPKTGGPRRRPVKLFEVKIYLFGPQMTPFLFKNLLPSMSPESAGWTSKPGEVMGRKEASKVKVFCTPQYKSVSELAFW